MASLTLPSILALACLVGSALSQCPGKNETKPSLAPRVGICDDFTPDYVSRLVSAYNEGTTVSVGVRIQSSGSTPGNPADLNIPINDAAAYASCCRSCAASSSCVAFSISITSGPTLRSDGSVTVKYRCNTWPTYCLRTVSPVTKVEYTTYPATFLATPKCPPTPAPTCTDDAVSSDFLPCPALSIEADDDGQVSPQFQCATANNFITLGKGAVVKGRFVSSTSNPSFLVSYPGYSPQQCVAAAWNIGAGETYFTWESCSQTCKLFQSNACTTLNGVPNAFTPSATAFSGRVNRPF